jgi:hypothetical protein
VHGGDRTKLWGGCQAFGGEDVECSHDDGQDTIFCALCNKQRTPGLLRSVNLAGFVGVENSTSPAIERFWRTGDPAALATPKDPDYVPGFSLGRAVGTNASD